MTMEQAIISAGNYEASLPSSHMIPIEAELYPMCVGDIELDPSRRTVRKSGHRVHLTPKEFELAQLLMSHAGRPIRHARLLAAVWGSGYGPKPEYLRTYVCQLRK